MFFVFVNTPIVFPFILNEMCSAKGQEGFTLFMIKKSEPGFLCKCLCAESAGKNQKVDNAAEGNGTDNDGHSPAARKHSVEKKHDKYE